MKAKSSIMVYILPKNFLRVLLWSGFFGLIFSLLILKKPVLQALIDLSFLLAFIALVIAYRLLRFVVRKLIALAKGQSEQDQFTFSRYDKKHFNKRVGQLRLSLKWVWHIMKIAFRHDNSDLQWHGRQEMVIRYPLNPNLLRGDVYHIQAMSSHLLEHEGRRYTTLQAYCYELQRVCDFEVDKIQQAYDYPTGMAVNTAELIAEA